MGIRPLRLFARHGREKLRARASRPLRRNRFGDGRRRKQTTGTRKKPRRSAPVEGAIFFPSVVGSGKLVFCKPYRSKSVFAYVIGYGRGKSSFLAHVLGYGRGKNSRHPAAAPQKRNCVFSQLRTGKKFVFAHVIGYGREKQRARLVFFWRSLLPVRARPPSSQIGPKKSATGKESTRTRSFSRPCWRTLFLLLLWRYVKGVSPCVPSRGPHALHPPTQRVAGVTVTTFGPENRYFLAVLSKMFIAMRLCSKNVVHLLNSGINWRGTEFEGSK